MKNITYIIGLYCVFLCYTYTAEDSLSSQSVKVPPLALGSHQRKRSNSEPQRIATSQHIVISPRKKVTGSRAQKHEKETRARSEEYGQRSSSTTKRLIDSVIYEDIDDMLLHRDSILAQLKELKSKKEFYEWHIAWGREELNALKERIINECLPFCNNTHASAEQKNKTKKTLAEIEGLIPDPVRRIKMFSDYLTPVLKAIQENEDRLAQIQVLLDQYDDDAKETIEPLQ